MMIVELIDEVDFKEKLIGIGAPIEPNDSLEEVATKVKAWMDAEPEQQSVVTTACDELEATEATILPDVHDLMKSLTTH